MIWAYPSTDRKKDILRTFLIFSPKACQGYHPPFAAGKMPPKIVLSPSANHTDRNQAWYRNTHPNLSPGPSNPRLTSPTFGLLFSPCFWALPYHLDRGLFSSPASPHQHVKTFIGRRQKLPSSHIPSSYSPFLLLILVRHFESTPSVFSPPIHSSVDSALTSAPISHWNCSLQRAHRPSCQIQRTVSYPTCTFQYLTMPTAPLWALASMMKCLLCLLPPLVAPFQAPSSLPVPWMLISRVIT